MTYEGGRVSLLRVSTFKVRIQVQDRLCTLKLYPYNGNKIIRHEEASVWMLIPLDLVFWLKGEFEIAATRADSCIDRL